MPDNDINDPAPGEVSYGSSSGGNGAPAPGGGRTRKRSLKSVGLIGITILLMTFISSFYLGSLPLVNQSPVYTARFNESAGLTAGNEVRIAGVRVGQVSDVVLDNDHVDVKFRVANTWIGDQTQASIQIKTLLGQKYLSIEPRGSKLANPRTTITDTVSPYDVQQAFEDASTQLGNLDTDRMATALRSISDAYSGTSQDMGRQLDGIARLSQTIGSRDQDVQTLFAATKRSSEIVADRSDEFVKMISGAGQLMDELNARQRNISALLVTTTGLSTSLSKIVAQNQAQIGPALKALDGVNATLSKQNANLRRVFSELGAYLRVYTNVVGNGRWFDTVIVNIFDSAAYAPKSGGRGPLLSMDPDKNFNNAGTRTTG